MLPLQNCCKSNRSSHFATRSCFSSRGATRNQTSLHSAYQRYKTLNIAKRSELLTMLCGDTTRFNGHCYGRRYQPDPEKRAVFAQARAKHLWQILKWTCTTSCFHRLCRRQSQEAVHAVLCVGRRLDTGHDTEDGQLCHLPIHMWYIILSFLTTRDLGGSAQVDMLD
jgi:hypothetical protein